MIEHNPILQGSFNGELNLIVIVIVLAFLDACSMRFDEVSLYYFVSVVLFASSNQIHRSNLSNVQISVSF